MRVLFMLSCTCCAIAGVPVIQFRTCFQKEVLILSISFYNLQFETGKKPYFSNLHCLVLSENEVLAHYLRKA